MISDSDLTEANDINAVKMTDMFDSYINIEVGLSRVNDDDLYHATFKQCVIDDDGGPLDIVTSNPITDTSIYVRLR